MSTLAARYVHKPTEVLAVEVTPDNIVRIANWVEGDVFGSNDELYIEVNNTEFSASFGDIVVLEDDEFYAMDKDAFNERYNPLDTTHLNGVWLTNPFSG